MAPAASGSIYFAGTTSSTDLPLASPSQPQYGGGESDAFAGRLNVDTRSLVFSTYIGGSGRDQGAAVSYASGTYAGGFQEPVVVGSTTSADLPVVNALQGQLAGPQDAFLANFDGAGSLKFLSYFGGSGADRGLALSVSADNVATIGGETDSPDLPMPARNNAPSVLSGGLDGFVSSIALTRFAIAERCPFTGPELIQS